MADEAVVRIVLDDGGTATPPAAPAPPPPAPARSADDQSQESRALLTGAAMPWAPPGKPIQAPTLIGMRPDQAEYLRLEAEAARAGLTVKEYRKRELEGLAKTAATAPPPPPPPAVPPTPPAAPPPPPPPPPLPPPKPPDGPLLATKPSHIAGSVPTAASFGQGDLGYPPPPTPPLPPEHLPPPEPPPDSGPSFDPVALAKKRVEREEQQAAVDAEYAKLKPPPPPKAPLPFDPVDLAKKRVKAEQEREAVEAEYAKLKPKGVVDSLLELAESLRGTIGGAFGTLAGAALDVTAKFREMRSKRTATTEATAESPPSLVEAIPPALTAATTSKSDSASFPAEKMPVPSTLGPKGAGPDAPPAPAEVPTGEIESLGAAAEATGSKLAAAVPVIGAVVVGAAAMVAAFKAVVGVVNEMVDRYGEYNPAIAQQQAIAEIRNVMGDMRRAQQSGRELAEFVRAQSEMQQRWEDIKVALMTKIIPIVSGILEVLSGLMGIASQSETFDKVNDPTEAIVGRKMGGLGSAEMIPEL